MLLVALRKSNSTTTLTCPFFGSLNGVFRGMADKVKRQWFPPEGCPSVEENDSSSKTTGGLMLYNSLLDEKVPFVPADGLGSKQITWYTCGKTRGFCHADAYCNQTLIIG